MKVVTLISLPRARMHVWSVPLISVAFGDRKCRGKINIRRFLSLCIIMIYAFVICKRLMWNLKNFPRKATASLILCVSDLCFRYTFKMQRCDQSGPMRIWSVISFSPYTRGNNDTLNRMRRWVFECCEKTRTRTIRMHNFYTVLPEQMRISLCEHLRYNENLTVDQIFFA